MDTAREETHLVPYRVYFVVWAILVFLTCLTVGAHYADMAHVAILTAILIATVKVTLVMLYFMHLRYAQPILIAMVVAVVGTYGIFLALTFTDYLAR